MRGAERSDLRGVGDDEHLKPLSQSAQPLADRRRGGAADTGIDLIEYQRRHRAGAGEHHLEGQHEAGELAAGGDPRQRSGGGVGVGACVERHALGAVRTPIGLVEGVDRGLEPRGAEPQRSKLAVHPPVEAQRRFRPRRGKRPGRLRISGARLARPRPQGGERGRSAADRLELAGGLLAKFRQGVGHHAVLACERPEGEETLLGGIEPAGIGLELADASLDSLAGFGGLGGRAVERLERAVEHAAGDIRPPRQRPVLERLRGQLRTIQDLVALATVSLTLVEPAPERLEARVEFVETAYAGDDAGARCPAADDLAVDEDEPVTICVSVENTGSAALVEIEIYDFGFELDDDDFVALEGSVAGPLQPGERLLGYFRTRAELESRPEPGFSAVAVDPDGEPLRITVNADFDVFEYEVAADNSLPTFVDGLRGSWGAVVTLGRVGVLAVGIAIPFLWIVPLALGLFWLGRRLNHRINRPQRPWAPRSTAAPAPDEGDSAEAPDR